jgi:hypothetical protein
MGGKVCMGHKGKTLLDVVNKLLNNNISIFLQKDKKNC